MNNEQTVQPHPKTIQKVHFTGNLDQAKNTASSILKKQKKPF